MKKHTRGASLYYASDKNVFDALNQHKVDIQTIADMFARRNILVSRRTSREELSRQFSRLTHDHYDHQDIAQRLDVTQRRERTTSLLAHNIPDPGLVQAAIKEFKNSLEADGDVVTITRTDDRFVVNVKYTVIDYARSEFTQRQHRDGEIELIKSGTSYIVRSTQNEHMNILRDTLLATVEKNVGSAVERETISMFDIPSPSLRTRFFEQLTNTLKNYSRRDVTDVYVYKPKPNEPDEDGEPEDFEPHIERVLLRGSGVGRSELFSDLSGKDYYVVKVTWRTKELFDDGNEYVIECAFSDVADCTGFSILIASVFQTKEGKTSRKRRQPTRPEKDKITRAIEKRAREIIAALRSENT